MTIQNMIVQRAVAFLANHSGICSLPGHTRKRLFMIFSYEWLTIAKLFHYWMLRVEHILHSGISSLISSLYVYRLPFIARVLGD